MSKKDTSYLIDYIILSVAVTVSVWLFYFFVGLPDVQYLTAKLLAAFYVIWGGIHHYHKGDFHAKVVIEYLVIAILSLIIIRGAIF